MTKPFILITGATSGFGKAFAESLSKAGFNLILTGRRKERLEEISKKLAKNGTEILTYNFDVQSYEACKSCVEDLKSKDIFPAVLINNAGLAAGLSKIQDGDISDWEAMIDTNIKGLLYMTRLVLPLMIKRNTGQIINLGSIAGHQVYPNGNVYNATKFAVKALTQAINIDLVGTNIRCCSIDPGAAETEFSLVRFKGNQDKSDSVYQGFKPLSAEDIADLVLYVIKSPAHVNIQQVLIAPTAQRNVYTVDRRN